MDHLNKHEGGTIGFHWGSRAWYSKAVGGNPDITIGVYHDDGGTTGEFGLVWHDLGDGGRRAPRLEVFEDAWSLLAHPAFAPLWHWLAASEGQVVTEEEVVTALKSLGFADLTSYVSPYGSR